MKIKTLLFGILIMATSRNLYCQDGDAPEKTKEFYLSVNDFSPVALAIAHKRQLKNKTFLKIGLIDLTLKTSSNFSKNNIRSGIYYSAGIESGVEFRKGITENFTFYHGPALSVTYGNNISRIDTLAIATVQSPSYEGSIPYSIGMLINVKDHFFVAAEINPGVTFTYRKFTNNNYNIATELSFSNRFAILSLVYRI